MLDADTYRTTPRRRPPSRFFPLEAEELMRSGQVENATELCKRGLIYFPENISGYAVLAQAYALLGQEERAINVLEHGYRRTGAEGLQTLRKIMRGEGVPVFQEAGESGSPLVPGELPPEEIAEDAIAERPIEANVDERESEESNAEETEDAIAEESVEAEAKESEGNSAEEIVATEEQIAEESPAEIGIDATGEEHITASEAKEEPVAVPGAEGEPVTAAEGIEETEEETEEREEKTERIEANAVESREEEEAEAVVAETAPDEPEAARVTEKLQERVAAESESVGVVDDEQEEEPLRAESEEETATKPTQSTVFEAEVIEPEAALPESDPEEIDLIEASPVKIEAPSAPLPPLGAIESGEEEPDAGRFRLQEKKFEAGPFGKIGEGNKTGRGGLSLHSGTKISRLSSSNLRLIPGLEFAPLRRDDDLKIRIAPLVNEPPPALTLSFDPIIPGLPSTPSPQEHSAVHQDEWEDEIPSTSSSEKITPQPGTESSVREQTTESEIGTDAAGMEGKGEEPIDLFPDIPESLPEDDFDLFLSDLTPAPSALRPELGTHYNGMTPLEELARRLENARIPIVEEEEDSYDSPAFEPSIVSDTFAAILAGQGAYAEAIKAYQMLARLKPERRQEYERKIAEMRWKMSTL